MINRFSRKINILLIINKIFNFHEIMIYIFLKYLYIQFLSNQN